MGTLWTRGLVRAKGPMSEAPLAISQVALTLSMAGGGFPHPQNNQEHRSSNNTSLGVLTQNSPLKAYLSLSLETLTA